MAYEDKRDRHDARTHIDYGLRVATKGGHVGWFADDTRPAELLYGVDIAWQMIGYRNVPDCVDAHNRVFVSASFELMLRELCQLGFLDLRVETLIAMPAIEFIVRLRPGREAVDPEVTQARRHALMNRILTERADQTHQIADSPLHVSRLCPLLAGRGSRLHRWLSAVASRATTMAVVPRGPRPTR